MTRRHPLLKSLLVVAGLCFVGCGSDRTSLETELQTYEDVFAVEPGDPTPDDEFGIFRVLSFNETDFEGELEDRLRLWFEEDNIHLVVKCAEGHYLGVTAPIELDRDARRLRTLEDQRAMETTEDGSSCRASIAWSLGAEYTIEGRQLTINAPLNQLVLEKISDG